MKQKQNVIFIAVMIVTFLACGSLWLANGFSAAHVSSGDGTRDLRGANFNANCFDLYGPVEYIPNALLTPEEFAARENEVQTVLSADMSDYGTERLRVYVPDGTYGLMMWNSDFAVNIYINGRYAESIGAPGENVNQSVAGARRLYYTVDAPNGVIEILQQMTSHVTPDWMDDANIIIGAPVAVREIYARQNIIASVVLGSFLALFLVHLVLYSLMSFYKANLWSALFCLVWFLSVGYSCPWILSSIAPLSWTAETRLIHLTYPAGLLLICMTFNELFPGVLHRWFCSTIGAVCAVFACVFLLADTAFSKETVLYFYVVFISVVAYGFVRLFVNLRKPNIEQIAIIAGMVVFLFGTLRDILNLDIIPAFLSIQPARPWRTSIEFALLVFVFFQMTVMFRNTVRRIAWANEAGQKMAAEAETQRQLNAMKSEFLGELSHELRMPISVISGFAQYFGEVLDDDPPDRNELRNSAHRIENEADRMDRLVGQLLDMAAIEAGRFTLKKEEVSVTALFDQIRKVYFPMMNGGHNRLIINLENDLTIHADRERILQILVNLVSNACKYTHDGEITLSGELKKSGELGVESGKLGNVVLFSVADTGEGMSQETLSALFTRYPKMRGGVKGEKGNGLGLFISKKIVEAHGGEIGVESETGKGTKVWFTI
jgi:signal transduction histidine kinase